MSDPITLEPQRATPDLRIVPTGDVIPHEHHDGQRLDPLVERLEADGRLLNPPVVAELGGDKYVVLDGANRVTALAQLAILHCLVQVVPYKRPFIDLHTWHHAITGMDVAALDTQVAAIDGLEANEADLIHAQAQLARRVLVCYYVRADGSVVKLEGSRELHERTAMLNHVVNVYLESGRLHRTNSEDIGELQTLFPGLAALVVFPSYEPAEILELAGDGEKIPPGLTRHVIHGRALRVNYPLEALRAGGSLSEKNDALATWMQDKMAQKRVRFYAESTFLFDE